MKQLKNLHTEIGKISLIFILLLSIQAFGQSSKISEKLEIKINKNIELLGLAYFIGFEGIDIENKTVNVNGKTYPKKDWHNYGFSIYEKYKSFASSENLATCFSVAVSLWFDYLTAFLLQVDDVPKASLSEAIDSKHYLNFSKDKSPIEAKNNAEIFLKGLNAFAIEINFDKYLSDSKEYYKMELQEVKMGLPDNDFIQTMESFYNKKFDHYLLVPSLTIPKGMGFGIKNSNEIGTEVFNVFGALDIQEFEDNSNLKMGFDNPIKLRELSVHEFGHSFVNPVVAKLPEHLLRETKYLFDPLKSVMSDQGYNTWKACVYEHFVRAGEIIIAEKITSKKNTERLLEEYVEKRQFKYLPEIITELKKYDNGEYKSYYEMVEKTMDRLKNL